MRSSSGLAQRLGARHPGFDMTAMEMIDATLRASGWPGAEEVLARRWIDAAAGVRGHAFPRRLRPPGQNIPFRRRIGAGSVPITRGCRGCRTICAIIDNATPDRPFRLVAAPARQFLNTSFTETPTARRREGRPTALVHPEDAGAARHRRRRPRPPRQRAREVVSVHARLFDGLQQGVVIVESIWPNADFAGRSASTP